MFVGGEGEGYVRKVVRVSVKNFGWGWHSVVTELRRDRGLNSRNERLRDATTVREVPAGLSLKRCSVSFIQFEQEGALRATAGQPSSGASVSLVAD